jgi:hypothetical protein
VVYEGPYSGYLAQRAATSALPKYGSAYSYVLHSVPLSNNLHKSVGLMRQHAQFLFLTTLTEDFYESFGSNWEKMLSVMTA